VAVSGCPSLYKQGIGARLPSDVIKSSICKSAQLATKVAMGIGKAAITDSIHGQQKLQLPVVAHRFAQGTPHITMGNNKNKLVRDLVYSVAHAKITSKTPARPTKARSRGRGTVPDRRPATSLEVCSRTHADPFGLSITGPPHLHPRRPASNLE